MLNIAITFDYELFFGENNSSDDEILFNPTAKILEVLKENNVTSTFFVDTCSVLMHQKYGLNSYVENFQSQMNTMLEYKQDVQLHIHPNWLKSEFLDNKWNFDTEHYRIHSFHFEKTNPDNAVSIIKNSKNYLEEYLKRNNPDYKCIAYRAGGYSIQPHDELFSILRESGILIDSSVCMHAHTKQLPLKYDYRQIPKKLNWWITPQKNFLYNGTLEEKGLFEVPLTCDRNRIFKRLISPRDYFILKKSSPKGSFISLNEKMIKKPSRLSVLAKYPFTYSLLSFDTMPYKRMIDTIKRVYRKYNGKNNDLYLSIICHPKITDESELKNIENFIKHIKQEKTKYRFVNMRDIYESFSNKMNL